VASGDKDGIGGGQKEDKGQREKKVPRKHAGGYEKRVILSHCTLNPGVATFPETLFRQGLRPFGHSSKEIPDTTVNLQITRPTNSPAGGKRLKLYCADVAGGFIWRAIRQVIN
jgi:hypothetical protein